jgi:hypothetical protein
LGKYSRAHHGCDEKAGTIDVLVQILRAARVVSSGGRRGAELHDRHSRAQLEGRPVLVQG